MKQTLLIIVLSLCGAVLLMAIFGVFANPTEQPEDIHYEGISTGWVDFTQYDAVQENKVVFHCMVKSFRQIEVPDEVKDDVAARYILAKPWILSKDDNSEDTAEIQAKTAILDRIERIIRDKPHTAFNADMVGDVKIDGKGKNFLKMRGERVSMDNERKTFSSNRLIVISDRQDERMLIKGIGMHGMVDGKGMSFKEDVVAYFAGSNFSGSPQEESDAEIQEKKEQRTTRITCDGPMKLRRYDDFPAILDFVETFEILRATLAENTSEQNLIDALAYYQGMLIRQRLSHNDNEVPALIESDFAKALPHLKTRPTPETVKQITVTLGLLKEISGRIDAEEYAVLKRLARDLENKNNDLNISPDGNGDVSLIIITFNRNVVAVTRAFRFVHISELAKEDDETNLYMEPYIDSWQKCEKLSVYFIMDSGKSDKDGSQDVIEPVKIEMLGGDKKVYMKSYSPIEEKRADGKTVKLPEKKLNSTRECREAHLLLESVSGQNNGGGDKKRSSQITQKEIRMIGDVRLQMMGDDETNRKLYEARGASLVWRRPSENAPDSGRSELIGSPQEPLMISYSNIASPEFKTKGQHSVIGRCSDRISMIDLDSNRKLVVLSKDVRLEMSRAGSDAGEPLETLEARDWVELTFDKRQMDKKDSTGKTSNKEKAKPGGDVFGGVERLEAAGETHTTGRKGQTRSDLLVYHNEKYEGRPAGIIDLYKITDDNRQRLLHGRPFTGLREWPLEAIMYSGSSTDVLNSMRQNETGKKQKDSDTLSTFTITCSEIIRHIEFYDMAKSDPPEKIAAISNFYGDVKIERRKANSRDTAYITADKSITMKFVARTKLKSTDDEKGRNKKVDEKRGRSSHVDLVAMDIVGPAAITETIIGRNDSRIQLAEGDRILWEGTPRAATAKNIDRTIITGTGETTPKLTYVIEKPRSKSTDNENNDRVTEETMLYCSHKDGRITITRIGTEKDQNELLAESAAHVLRREQVDSAGKKPWTTLLRLRAETLKLYMEEIPAAERQGGEDSKTNIRLRKFEAYEDVLVGDDSYTAHAHKATWQSTYGADVVEVTRLIATKDGGPSVIMNRLDTNGRPSSSQMTSTDSMVITKTIFDETIFDDSPDSPKYASRMTLVVTGNARIRTRGFADIKNRELPEDTLIICDELTVIFKEELRSDKAKKSDGETAAIKEIIARGNARYFVYGTLKEGDPYPQKAVMIRKGEGGLIHYNAPGSNRPVGEMYGTKDANGKYIRPAQRWEYYTQDRKKFDRDEIYDAQNYLPVKKYDDE